MTDMTDSMPAEDEQMTEEQPTPPAVRGSFQEIYNALTRQSYVYRDGEWIPKPKGNSNDALESFSDAP